MRTFALFFTIVLWVSISLQAEPELRGTPVELAKYLPGVPRVVALVGEGEIKVPADRASVSVKVVTENRSLQEASRMNQELRAKMVRTLADKGVPADRVQASKFSSTPKYGMFGDKAKSYRVDNTVKVTVQDEKEFQAVAGLVDATAEFRYDSIEFERSDKDRLKQQVVVQALDKTLERKKLYEEKLDVKLVAWAFTEQSQVIPIVLSQRGYAASFSKVTTDSASGLVRVERDMDGEMPTSFGELIFKTQVTVEYSVESK